MRLALAGRAHPRQRAWTIRSAAFRWFWTGQSLSLIGDQFALFGLPLLVVTTLHQPASEVALLTTASTLPFLVLGLPAGVLADRVDRRLLMLVADLVRMVAFTLMALLAFVEKLNLPTTLALLVAAGCAVAVFEVAYPSYLPLLVRGERQVTAGNTRLALSDSASLVAGPALAGPLVQALGTVFAVLVNAASFLASVCSLALVRAPGGRPPPPPAAPARSTVRSDLAAGLRLVWRHPLLRPMVMCGVIYNFFTVMMTALRVVFGVSTLHLSAATVGVCLGTGAFGLPVGNLLAARMGTWLGQGRSLIVSTVIAVAGPALLPLAVLGHPVVLLVAGNVIAGLGVGSFQVNYVVLRQLVSPPHMLGRVNAVFRFLARGALPVGGAAAAALAGATSVTVALVVASIGAMACLAPLVASPLRQRPARAGDLSAQPHDISPPPSDDGGQQRDSQEEQGLVG
jgi:MFS family permease